MQQQLQLVEHRARRQLSERRALEDELDALRSQVADLRASGLTLSALLFFISCTIIIFAVLCMQKSNNPRPNKAGLDVRHIS